MSNESSPKKPFMQVPNSSPIGPSSTENSPVKHSRLGNLPPTRSLIDHQNATNGDSNNNDYDMLSKNKYNENSIAALRQKFAYNPSTPSTFYTSSTTSQQHQNLLNANANANGSNNGSNANATISKKFTDDMAILRKKYPTCKEGVLTQTWKRKKGNLRQIIEFLNGLQKSHPQFFKSKPETAVVHPLNSQPTPVLDGGPSLAERRLKSFSENSPNAVRTSKLNPLKKKLSIQQKFGIEKPQEPPKKRRLIRGSRNPKPDYNEDEDMNGFINDDAEEEVAVSEEKKSTNKQSDLAPASSLLKKYTQTTAAPPKKGVINLSDDEEEDAGANSEEDDDSDVADYTYTDTDAIIKFNEKVLDFLNTAELRDLCDIGGCTPLVAEKLIEKRPIASLAELEQDDLIEEPPKKNGRGGRRGVKKPNGLKLIEKTQVTLKGYDAVESLVQKCSEYGTTISQEISKWGINVIGERGELEMTEIDPEKIEKDALESEDDDEEGAIKTQKKRSKGTYFKHKPKLLAEDLELKSYQQVGINWLNLLYQNNLSCILADEMGLGKTCQVISFFAYLKEIGVDDGPHLVVVPSSTLENWLREFKKFCPELKVSPYYGSQLERYELRMDLANTDFDILVTTYNLTTGHKDDMKFLRNQGFNVIVYDEGHMLKNSASERYNKLMKLKGKFRLLLTGTPLQNNLKELISLLAFILPDLFKGKKDDLQVLFNQKAKTASESGSATPSNPDEQFNPLLSVRAISRAKTMMTPFVLRRKKQQVLKNLPKKHTFIDYCDATEEQAILYKQQIDLGRKAKFDPKVQSSNIIMKLRKAAIHPLLFKTHYNDKVLRKMAADIMKEPVYRDANAQFIFEDMQVMTDFELHNLCMKFGSIRKHKLKLDEEIFNSGKFLKLKELLPKFIIKDDRILIFSLFTQVLDILEVLLTELDINFLRLDGQTSVDLRQDIIDQFYNDESIKVFILSTKAGGFGINLACANTVIILDQSFNPHDDRQAEDRAHRVGQKRDVKVVRLITKNTIEENIYTLAQNKLALDQSVSGDGTETGNVSDEKVSESLFKELFN